MSIMAITTIKHYPFGKLVYLTGGAYELHKRTGNVLIMKVNRRSKTNDATAVMKCNEYLKGVK